MVFSRDDFEEFRCCVLSVPEDRIVKSSGGIWDLRRDVDFFFIVGARRDVYNNPYDVIGPCSVDDASAQLSRKFPDLGDDVGGEALDSKRQLYAIRDINYGYFERRTGDI